MTSAEKNKRYRKRHPIRWLRISLYNMAQKRVRGFTNHPRAHIWIGLELCSKSEFNAWFDQHLKEITKIFKAYIRSGKDRKLAPSVNRIESDKGYIPSNMEILTVSENSRIAGKILKGPNAKPNRRILT